MALYLRSNSLVRRKFKIGANAVGSLSINIWKYGDRTESAAVNCGGSQQVLSEEIWTQKSSRYKHTLNNIKMKMAVDCLHLFHSVKVILPSLLPPLNKSSSSIGAGQGMEYWFSQAGQRARLELSRVVSCHSFIIYSYGFCGTTERAPSAGSF